MHDCYGRLYVGITVVMLHIMFPPFLPILEILIDISFVHRGPISKALYGRYAWSSLHFSLYSMFHTATAQCLYDINKVPLSSWHFISFQLFI